MSAAPYKGTRAEALDIINYQRRARTLWAECMKTRNFEGIAAIGADYYAARLWQQFGIYTQFHHLKGTVFFYMR
jgi:hypothetical protein